MPALNMRKKMNVFGNYLQGFGYQGIASRSGVSKGSVVNIIDDLREGRFPGFENVADEIDVLRELAVEVRRSGLSVSQAALGLIAFQGLESLGLPPSEARGVIAKFRQLTPEGTETQTFLAAVSKVIAVQERSGMGPAELEEMVGELEARYHQLERSCQELEPVSEEVAKLASDRDRLVEEKGSLESEIHEGRGRSEAEIADRTERLEGLESQVAEKEKLTVEMSQRILDQEGHLRETTRRLDRATDAIDRIARLGLSEDDLLELATRLTSAAHHHEIEPARFHGWLFSCLDRASSLLELETMVKDRQKELAKAERKLTKTRDQEEALASEVQAIKKQGSEEKASQRVLRKAWAEEIRSLGPLFTEAANVEMAQIQATVRSFDQRISAQQAEMQDKALSLGGLKEAIDSYALVRPLVNLLHGKDEVTLDEARIAATALCLGLLRFLEVCIEHQDKPALLGMRVKSLLEALEGWKT